MTIPNSIRLDCAGPCPNCGWSPPYGSYYPDGPGFPYPRFELDYPLTIVIHKCIECKTRFDYYE